MDYYQSYDGPKPHQQTLMFGTSAGIENVHDPRTIPFDTITYFLRAEEMRSRLENAVGLFFAFDKRLNSNGKDQAQINSRTEHLRILLQKVLPRFDMTTHREMEEQGLASRLEKVPTLDHVSPEEFRQYARMQTAQVLHMRDKHYTKSAEGFTKFGWILARRGPNATPVGGEVNFDQLLPENIGVDYVYTGPGFPLNSSDGKAPYLLHEKDRQNRICLPERADAIGTEVAKIRAGIQRIGHDTVRMTAETILGLRNGQATDNELDKLPLSKTMKQQMTDEKTLEETRQVLEAALLTLLP